jgi:signal transduction histidine kinase
MGGAVIEGPPLSELLRRIPMFAELSDDDVAAICRSSVRMKVAPGTRFIEEGAPGEALYVVLTGAVEVIKDDNGREIVLAARGPGEVLGEMSLLEQRPRTATVRAVRDSEVLEIGADTFRQLLETNPSIATTVLRTVAARLRSTESSMMQAEKLASLGTLAAGLAHELNNPAAAIRRSSAILGETLTTLGARSAELVMLDLSSAERDHVATLEQKISNAITTETVPGDEDALIELLESFGVADPWDIAPAFASQGWSAADLRQAADGLAPNNRNVVLGTLGARLVAAQLTSEIQRSAEAISNIVRAVKSYAYLDQAAVQLVDLKASLEDTLMILKHKLKTVTVVKNFEPDLPRLQAYAGELNQVWTNLIDNAADSMAGKGTLEVGARQLGDVVEVTIADSGSGIPPEILGRIFDPFFTTKPQGVGTGIGLHIVHNIIVNRHRGTIDVNSEPGRTVFRVTLPMRLQEAPPPPRPAPNAMKSPMG